VLFDIKFFGSLRLFDKIVNVETTYGIQFNHHTLYVALEKTTEFHMSVEQQYMYNNNNKNNNKFLLQLIRFSLSG
jgi:hypothetical protein